MVGVVIIFIVAAGCYLVAWWCGYVWFRSSCVVVFAYALLVCLRLCVGFERVGCLIVLFIW